MGSLHPQTPSLPQHCTFVWVVVWWWHLTFPPPPLGQKWGMEGESEPESELETEECRAWKDRPGSRGVGLNFTCRGSQGYDLTSG